MNKTTSSLDSLISSAENKNSEKIKSENYTIKLFGITYTSNDGSFENGRESFTQVFTSYENCVESAYENYCSDWEELEKNKVIDTESCYVFLSREEFEKELKSQGLTVIQCYDCHFQYELFEQELIINKDMLKDYTKNEVERGL